MAERTHPSGADVADWVADRLVLDGDTRRRITAALMDGDTASRQSVWWLEFDHDGSGRVDVSVGVPRPSGREGRQLLPVADEEALTRLIDTLRACGPADLPVDRLRRAAPFVTTGTTLLVEVDYLPDQDRFGSHLGVEIAVDPRIVDVFPTLATLGVDGGDAERMRRLAARLPFARERTRDVQGRPVQGPGRTMDAVEFAHVSVSWTPEGTRLTSHVKVMSGPASSPAQRLEEAGEHMSASWPDRVQWSRRQLPTFQTNADDPLQAWRAAVDPASTGQFARRLELDGLSLDQARTAASPLPDMPERDGSWLPYFRRWRAACLDDKAPGPVDEDPGAWLDRRTSGWAVAAADVPFAPLLWPGVIAAWEHLMRAHPDLIDGIGPGAVDDLRLALLARLGEVVAPTLAQRLDDGLTFGQRVLRQMGDEPKDPPRAHFAHVCHELAHGDLDDLLLAHPVLPSLVGTVIRQWHDATVEMLTRLVRHRVDLQEHLGVDASAVLTGAAVAAGDRHNDGRSVAVLAFGRTHVAYKPRDCRLELLWEGMVDLLNGHLPADGLRAARTVVGMDAPGSHYGFAEFIDHAACTTAPEERRFYVNAGRTLALLHALSATDCHFENLVAHGEQLVLVDAEALFETRSNRTQALEPGSDSGLSTVLQVGMLPTWLWLEGEGRAVDITALGCSAGSGGGTSYRGWRAVNTDEMTRGKVSAPRPHPASLPTPDGVAPDLPAHVDDVVQGFQQGYRAIMAARSTGLVDVLVGAGHLSRRLIQRPTYVYAALLARSREPEALRDVAARGLVLELLTRAYLSPEVEASWPLLAAEQQAMARLDVPHFEATLDGRETHWRGGRLADWPGDDALSQALARVSRFSEGDLAWQSRLIRASVAAHGHRATRPEPGLPPGPGPMTSTPRDMADRCRAQISGDVLRPDGQVTWMTLGVLPDGEHVNVQALGSGLYDGTVGLSVFLYEAGEHDLADAALRPLIDALNPDDPTRTRRQLLAVGPGMSGSGGYLRALRLLARRGHIADESAARVLSAVIRATMPSSLDSEQRLDALNGVAGVIAPLCAALAESELDAEDRDRARSLVRAAAERLLDRQAPDGGWHTLPGRGPLTGLAHGASGIAVALVEAARALDEPRYLAAAMRALAYEESLFDVGVGNWPDLRNTSTGGFMLGWCAGAPGIGLARMRLLELLPEHDHAGRWRADLDVAAVTTAASSLLARDHLCCGNLGRAAILRTLGGRLGQPSWLAAADTIVDGVLARAADGLPRSILGTESDVLSIPGLMTGRAGAGLMLLRDDPSAWTADLLI